jgi:hypothetical protein
LIPRNSLNSHRANICRVWRSTKKKNITKSLNNHFKPIFFATPYYDTRFFIFFPSNFSDAKSCICSGLGFSGMSGLPEEGGLSAGCFKETLFWIAN